MQSYFDDLALDPIDMIIQGNRLAEGGYETHERMDTPGSQKLNIQEEHFKRYRARGEKTKKTAKQLVMPVHMI